MAKLEKQREVMGKLSKIFRDGFADALDEIVLKGDSARKMMAGFLESFERMTLEGALTGAGILFGMGGSADSKNPTGGGIFSLALMRLGTFADGG